MEEKIIKVKEAIVSKMSDNKLENENDYRAMNSDIAMVTKLDDMNNKHQQMELTKERSKADENFRQKQNDIELDRLKLESRKLDLSKLQIESNTTNETERRALAVEQHKLAVKQYELSDLQESNKMAISQRQLDIEEDKLSLEKDKLEFSREKQRDDVSLTITQESNKMVIAEKQLEVEKLKAENEGNKIKLEKRCRFWGGVGKALKFVISTSVTVGTGYLAHKVSKNIQVYEDDGNIASKTVKRIENRLESFFDSRIKKD